MKTIAKKKGSVSKKTNTLPKAKKTEDVILSVEDTKTLERASLQADLSQPIVKLRLEKYKIEVAKLNLEKQAGNLIPRALAEYLYTGYLDRLNRELLQYRNKMEVQFEHVLSDLIIQVRSGEEIVPVTYAKKMTKLIERETEELIRNIKSAQLSELKQWAKDEGVSL